MSKSPGFQRAAAGKLLVLPERWQDWWAMTFEEAKRRRDQLDSDVARYSDTLNSFPKGPTGLTPDHVRATREWQAAKAGFDRAFQALRKFNEQFVKVFRKELEAERRVRRGQVPNGNIPDADESARQDDLTAYNSTLLNHLHGAELDRVLAGEIKRRGLSDAEYRRRSLENVHPDDLVRALAESGVTLGSFGISEVRREHVPNVRGGAGRLAKTHLLVAGRHVPECNRMGRHASGFQGVALSEYTRLPTEERCERCDARAVGRLKRIRDDKRAKGEPVSPIVLRWLGEGPQHVPNGRTKASDRIRLSNGDVMTLGEALDQGRVRLNRRDNPPHKHPSYTAWDGDAGWDISEKLYLSRIGKQRPERPDSPHEAKVFGICEDCLEEAAASTTRRKQLAESMLRYDKPKFDCGACGEPATREVAVDLVSRDMTDMGMGDEQVATAHTPNHAAVHYVWLVDYRGVPLDTEGPYGPMSLASAEQNARIGASKGEHDRVVSIGSDIMAPGFEILRRYRRGTGERVQ